MTTPTDLEILGNLERLAASFPWDRVDIWTSREPNGLLRYTAYVAGNDSIGTKSHFGYGVTPEDCVRNAIQSAGERDPEKLRDQKVAELRGQIEKLLSVQIGLPPYVPNRELAQVTLPRTVDI